ncbi:MAG: DUF3421 domain-containing protein, partial [Chitinophagales bacterium]
MKHFIQHFMILALLLIFSSEVFAQLSWTSFQGRIPQNAVIGGSENGKSLAVCRCNYQGGTHPGKVVSNMCHIGWGGKEIFLKQFDVLTHNGKTEIKWIPSNGSSIPSKAFKGGSENGNPLFIGRVNYKDRSGKDLGVHPGKVMYVSNRGRRRSAICNFGWGGREIVERNNFEVLAER